MLEIGPLLKRGWTFVAAFREVIERLTPDNRSGPFILGRSQMVEIGVCSGGRKRRELVLLSVGNFGHIVVWGAEKDKTLAKVKDTLARPSAPQRS